MTDTTRRALGLDWDRWLPLLSCRRGRRLRRHFLHKISNSFAIAAGSGADTYVRFFAEKMKAAAKRNVVVQNRVGLWAYRDGVRSAFPNPTVIPFSSRGGSALAANHNVMKSPTVDIANELQVIGTINKQPNMIMVAAEAPWKTLGELVEAMKKKGEKASFAIANPSPGGGRSLQGESRPAGH